MSFSINLVAGWAGIFLGCVTGAVQGLWFHRDDWLGGYGSWPRRMMRLGHISLVALGLLNLAAAVTLTPEPRYAGSISKFLLVGAVTMPLVCYGAAARPRIRHLFPVPAVFILSSLALIIRGLIRP